jgi:hypothetical protein
MGGVSENSLRLELPSFGILPSKAAGSAGSIGYVPRTENLVPANLLDAGAIVGSHVFARMRLT